MVAMVTPFKNRLDMPPDAQEGTESSRIMLVGSRLSELLKPTVHGFALGGLIDCDRL